MLEAEVSHLVAQGYEEVIASIVSRLIERSGFADEVAISVEGIGLDAQILGAGGCHVEEMLRRDLGSEQEFLEELPGEKRRVDQLLERDCFELNRSVAFACFGEGCAVLPAGGQFGRRLHGDVGSGMTGGINEHFVPADDG